MKKLTAILLTAILVLSVSITVLADGTTTLTTTVPAATYTLNIPADQEITFGAERSNIGNVTVTDAAGFAVGKDLQVTVIYDVFSSDSVSTVIPYTLRKSYQVNSEDELTATINSGETLTFRGKHSGSVEEKAEWIHNNITGCVENIFVKIQSEDWGKALAGEYSTTITFTSEVVSSGN